MSGPKVVPKVTRMHTLGRHFPSSRDSVFPRDSVNFTKVSKSAILAIPSLSCNQDSGGMVRDTFVDGITRIATLRTFAIPTTFAIPSLSRFSF